MAQPSDETVRLIRQGMIDTDQQCRYYRYLAQRLRRLGEILGIVTVSGSLAALFTIVSPLPRWAPLTALGITMAATTSASVLRYQHKAARCAQLHRQLTPLVTEWQDLFSGIDERDDAELRNSCRNLSQQQTALLNSPDELPQSNSLMLRCRREAGEYWARRLDHGELGNDSRQHSPREGFDGA